MGVVARNTLAFIVGVVVTLAVNGGLITASPHIIPPPPGVDVKNVESMKASIHLFEAKHFLMPFLAHALGTLAGSFVAALLAASHRSAIAFGIGALHMAGGIAACFMIPAPAWFMALDLVGAYLPMAWLGLKGAEWIRPTTSSGLTPGR
jgi:hypothetical protein